jgi:hypothetical protein
VRLRVISVPSIMATVAPVALLDQQIARLDGGQALRRVVGLEHHGLQPGPVLRPRGHQQQRRDGGNVMVMAHRRFDLGAEALAQRLHDLAIGRVGGPRPRRTIGSQRRIPGGWRWRWTGSRAFRAHVAAGCASARSWFRAWRGGSGIAAPGHVPAREDADEHAAEDQRPQRHVHGGEGMGAVEGIERDVIHCRLATAKPTPMAAIGTPTIQLKIPLSVMARFARGQIGQRRTSPRVFRPCRSGARAAPCRS